MIVEIELPYEVYERRSSLSLDGTCTRPKRSASMIFRPIAPPTDSTGRHLCEACSSERDSHRNVAERGMLRYKPLAVETPEHSKGGGIYGEQSQVFLGIRSTRC
jgi:hypothetical protein